MRTLIDTCLIFDWIVDPKGIDDGVWNIIDETVRELVVSFNNKNILNKHWKTAKEMLQCIENDYGLEILPITRNVVATYTGLQLNLDDDHKDPSDHIIISHAITEHLTLISSDTRFPFYRNQGLDLIEY